MCGIIGIASKNGITRRDWLSVGRDIMFHRGPDDAGEWWSMDGRVGFGHRRLAIIDLSPAGHQPMVDISGQFTVVLNGEIYNYKRLRSELTESGHEFRSFSDTEVLLESYKKWGIECLDHLTGAFSFAIYDTLAQEVFVARDRAGEKPLFYYHLNNCFVFASELKALMASPMLRRQLNLDAFDHYLAYGYVSWNECILKDAHKLPPAHAAIYQLGTDSFHAWRYWTLPPNMPEADFSIEDLTDELETIFSESVQRQLVADVPIGILLSGGLDSSLITAVAARTSSQPIRTFTVSFPGHGAFDEGPYARLVAEHFCTEHTELIAEPALVSLLPLLAKQYDEPIADHSIVPTSMLASIVAKSVKVVLGGDGGDELFGGYLHYNLLQRIMRWREHMPRSVREGISLIAAHALPVGTKGRNHLIGLKGDVALSISAVNQYFDEVSRRRILAPLVGNRVTDGAITPELRRAMHFDSSLSICQNIAKTDFCTTLPDDYLVKSDRASMLHSLELRAPFLDHRLIEFAFARVPDGLKATSDERKIILRKLAGRFLPFELNVKRKQGFSLPLRAWFDDGWGDFVMEVLMEADPNIFDKRVIADLVKLQRHGFANTDRLFALTMFELWRREYRVTV